MPQPKPVLVERSIQTKVWGGQSLRDLFGIDGGNGQPIGETWELFDRPEGSSSFVGGGTLRQLMDQDRRALLGRAAPGFGGRFPLLFKFLDAQDSLSVQVHPGDELASVHGDGGKTEAWVVLRTAPDARIVRGFRPGVTRARFEAAARGQDLEQLLWSFRPEVGDVIHVPAGTVHAVGPGAVIFEVQQNSDITWRIWDWGRGRPLHVEQALAAARIDDGSQQPTVAPRPLRDGGSLLLQTPYFRLRRYALRQKAAMATDGAFLVVTVLGGRGTLGWQSGGQDEPLRLVPGACALVPACTGEVFLSPIGSLDVVVTDPGA
jgi:mannose-6-phosphate isomerase